MIRFLAAILVVVTLLTPSFAAEPSPGLSQQQIASLVASLKMDARTIAATNAVSNNDIRDLALSRRVAAVNDDVFSFSLPVKGMTDQESSGRCWMFAGLNILRQSVIKKYELDDFELSQSYLAFWDKLEKANTFLEYVIELRDRDILDRELCFLLDDPIGDGGYWPWVVDLVQKYGVVPKKFMGETKSSANTSRMDYILTSLLRRDACELRRMATEKKSVEGLRGEKNKMLEGVFRVLVINYGQPPSEFVWRTESDSGTVSEPVTCTPQSFYRDIIGVDLADYVSLANYPLHPLNRRYSVNLTHGMADGKDFSFINLSDQSIKSYALKALLDSSLVWFGADMGHDVHGKKGLMISGLYDYEELFGVQLDMTKEDRLDYRHSASNHSMVLTGVDMADGKPSRWRVENSWGKDRGDDGYFTMSDGWFDEYVLNVVVPRTYLAPEVAALEKQTPTPLPVWDPAWKALRW